MLLANPRLTICEGRTRKQQDDEPTKINKRPASHMILLGQVRAWPTNIGGTYSEDILTPWTFEGFFKQELSLGYSPLVGKARAIKRTQEIYSTIGCTEPGLYLFADIRYDILCRQ